MMDCTVDELTEFFGYLDELRESGETNMYGARPYLQAEFELEGKAAGKVLVTWMETFAHDDPPNVRAAAALEG